MDKDARIAELEQKAEWQASRIGDLRHQLDVVKCKLNAALSQPRRCKECPLGDDEQN